MTTSESLFLEYCLSRGYHCEAIPVGDSSRKTPDFWVSGPNWKIVAEVKELAPSEDDLRQNKEMLSQGWTSGGGKIGDRVRTHLRAAAKQLKASDPGGVPAVVILYDNIRFDGKRAPFPYCDLQSYQIDAAMYGNLQAHYSITTGGIRPSAPDTAGPGRVTTVLEKTYLSAVCVLYDLKDLSMATYHNFHAKTQLPFEVFNGATDAHLFKPRLPDNIPGHWEIRKKAQANES